MVCEKCQGRGWTPGRDKHTRFYCDCSDIYGSYQPVTPEDFDFPCSPSWRGYYSGSPETREMDTSYLEDRVENLEELSHENVPIPDSLRDRLDQLQGMVYNLKSKLVEHTNPDRNTEHIKHARKQETGYKGVM